MRRAHRIALACTIVLCVLVGQFLWLRTQSVEAVALRAMEQFLARDFKGLAQHALDEEYRGGQLVSDLEACWEVAIGPVLSQATPLPGIEVNAMPDVHGAIATKRFRMANGEFLHLPITIFETDQGPRGRLLVPLLSVAWRARYASGSDYQRKPGDLFRSAVAGIERDRAELERRGVTGFLMSPPDGFKDWNGFAAIARSKLTKAESP